eukprot:TRINITY_DN1265_c0_g1_i1.p1 TRINITY_DN1265_c0_g1~~TRINITY_DN1265_c0_g1_i1.p1  ORF type:complete len:308 (-),score=66.85 TRINITY_DN1265_c0_g1_i1:355-1278(-)
MAASVCPVGLQLTMPVVRPGAFFLSCQGAPSSVSFSSNLPSSNRLALRNTNHSGKRHTNESTRLKRRAAVCEVKKLSEVEAVPAVGEDKKLGPFPSSAGVYAVYDKVGTLQFVGISRRISSSIQAHVDDLPDLTSTVKVGLVESSEKSVLTDAWKAWLEEYLEAGGEIPTGNQPGNTTWTQRKPRRTKADIKITPGPHVKLTVPFSEIIDKVVKENKVVAFIKGSRTAPQCGFSHRVLTILNEEGIDYETLNVLDEHHNEGLREAIKAYSQWPTIPQVYVNGEFIGGADILSEMVTSGELKKVLGKA